MIISLFLSAFLAATLLPFSSEAALAASLPQGFLLLAGSLRVLSYWLISQVF